MANKHGYKKYMKKGANNDGANNNLVKIFVFSFFGMLLFFTFLIKSFSPSVDVSIGDYKSEQDVEASEDVKKVVDDRLAMIQSEDQGKSFEELVSKATDVEPSTTHKSVESNAPEPVQDVSQALQTPAQDVYYKVYVGNYTSAEQAKVAKDIIQESGNGLNPIVKCIGSNSYTLQVGIFKNKASAESLLYTVQQNHLPGRIIQDY